MRRMRIMGICVGGFCALGAMAATSASAALPEIGRCLPVEGEKVGKKNVYHGGYGSARCTRENPSKHGHFEWYGGSFEKPKFSGGSEAVTLQTVGGRKIVCSTGLSEGTYTGAKTETVKLTFDNCEEPSTKTNCQNVLPPEGEPVPIPGQIQTKPLKGELGFITTGEKPTVGWDLKPAEGTILAEFECAKGTLDFLEGSVINQVKKNRVNKMTEEFILIYSQAGGKQAPEQFEGGPKDTLTVKLVTLLPPSESNEQLGLAEVEEVKNEEPLEIKAK
jgi:hypothetical protein